MIGRFTTPNVPSIVAIGDSILDGTSDGTNPIPVVTGNGYLNRAALDADGANPIAMMNMTRSSASTANFLGGARTDYWAPYLQYANIVVDELGSNDFGLNAPTRRAASLRTSIGQMWALYRAAGVQRIIRTTFQPRITGGSGTSAAEQTNAGGWGNGGERDAINATFAGDLQAGTIDALVNFNPVWEDGNSGKW